MLPGEKADISVEYIKTVIETDVENVPPDAFHKKSNRSQPLFVLGVVTITCAACSFASFLILLTLTDWDRTPKLSSTVLFASGWASTAESREGTNIVTKLASLILSTVAIVTGVIFLVASPHEIQTLAEGGHLEAASVYIVCAVALGMACITTIFSMCKQARDIPKCYKNNPEQTLGYFTCNLVWAKIKRKRKTQEDATVETPIQKKKNAEDE